MIDHWLILPIRRKTSVASSSLRKKKALSCCGTHLTACPRSSLLSSARQITTQLRTGSTMSTFNFFRESSVTECRVRERPSICCMRHRSHALIFLV